MTALFERVIFSNLQFWNANFPMLVSRDRSPKLVLEEQPTNGGYCSLPLHGSKAATIEHTAGDFRNIAVQREFSFHVGHSRKSIVTVKVRHGVGNRQITRKARAILERLPPNAGNVRRDYQVAGQIFASPKRIRCDGGHTIEPILVKGSHFARWAVDKGRPVFAV